MPGAVSRIVAAILISLVSAVITKTLQGDSRKDSRR